MKLEIKVTTEDINEARKRISEGGHPASNCPIAIALHRLLNLERSPCVSGEIVYTDEDRFQLPSEAIEFQKSFDRRADIQSLEFYINDGRITAERPFAKWRPLHKLEDING